MKRTTPSSVTPDTVNTVDEMDAALIDLLKADGRMNFAEIAQHVGLSGEAVRQRFDRLERTGVVKIVGSVSPAVLGYGTFALVAIEVSGTVSAVAEDLVELPNIDFVASTSGEFDIVAEIVCKDDDELLDVLDAIRNIAGVHRCQSFMYLSFAKYSYDGGSPAGLGGAPTFGHSTVAGRSPSSLDDIDLLIIAALRDNGRASYAELAQITGLAYPSARRRVMRLRENDVLHIRTIVNPLVSEGRIQAGIGIKASSDLQEIADQLQDLTEVGMVLFTAGAYDMLLEVTCRDKTSLMELLGTKLRAIDGITSTHAHTFLRIHKLAYTWTGLTSVVPVSSNPA